MTLKGEWNSGTEYVKDDVVRYSNGTFYICVKPCTAGTPCADALYFNPLPSPLQECAKMVMDMAGNVPHNINDESIVLSDGTNEYMITVDGSGDTPELVVEEIEE